MTNSINILHLEDDRDFVDWVKTKFSDWRMPVSIKAVSRRQDFEDELRHHSYDIILADYTLPPFSGDEALGMVQENYPDIPFVYVTGTIGEEFAVEAIHRGAVDFVLKDNLNRLFPAVERALQILKERTRRKEVEQLILESEIRFRTVIDLVPHYVYAKDEQGIFILVNRAFAQAHGFSPQKMIGHSSLDVTLNKEEAKKYLQDDREVLEQNQIKHIAQEPFTDHRGKRYILQTTKVPFSYSQNKKGVLGVSVDNTENLAMETLLRESRERLNLALESSRMGTWDWNLMTGVTTWDEINHRIFGLEPGAFNGSYREFSERLHPDDRERIDRAAEECIEKGTEFYVDFRVIWPNQSVHWIRGRGRVHFDAQEKPVRMTGVSWDITEEKQRENKIQQLVQAVEQSPVSVIITNTEGVFEYVNPAFTKITGYTAEEALQHNPNILRSGCHSAEFYRDLWNTITSGKTWKGQLCNKKKDGTLYWESAVISPVMDEKGSILNYIAVKEDNTQQKQFEEAYQVLINQSILGLMIIQDQRVVFANERLAELSGIPINELYEMDMNDLLATVHPEDRAMLVERHRRRLQGEPLTDIYEYRGIKKNNEVQWIQAHSNLITYRGKPAVQTAIIDITERKRLGENLQQMQRMESIGQLAGGIAHDFNNVLMAIKMNTEFALNEIDAGSPIREDLKEVLASAKRASALTRQLLAFSRKQIMELKVINLNELTQNLDKMLRRLIGEHIELKTRLDPELGNVKADPGQVEQIILNLVVNARDAVTESGKITIETQNAYLNESDAFHQSDISSGAYVRIAVSDNGCGIPKDRIAKIFDPFFTTKQLGKGTGLGLSTVYGIVKQIGGSLNVYSEPNDGTTFHIYLPRVDEEKDEVVTPVEISDLSGNKTILVVEDEPSVRKHCIILFRVGIIT